MAIGRAPAPHRPTDYFLSLAQLGRGAGGLFYAAGQSEADTALFHFGKARDGTTARRGHLILQNRRMGSALQHHARSPLHDLGRHGDGQVTAQSHLEGAVGQ